MNKRSSGILLHITSLPGDEGTGTMGKEACRFIDFLAETGQQLWQILPLGPPGAGNCPYQCFSAFAGNPLLIDLQTLTEEGLLSEKDFQNRPGFMKHRVNFAKTAEWKHAMLELAFANFRKNENRFSNEYHFFLKEHSWWLHDFALFMAAKKHFSGKSWHQWEKALKLRERSALEKYSQQLKEEIDYHKFVQFLFFRQWFRLKDYAHSKGVKIVGDLPLYVAGESADVWANPDIFLLDENHEPLEVGGVPPDYFSETGQLWGNPVYNWPRLKEREFDWWMARLHFNLNFFDWVRIDHFRGLESFWSVPAGEKDAVRGKWVPAHGREVLALLQSQIGELPLFAEDLGIITPEVDKLREDFGLPGMKVLQFAFTTDAANRDLPHNYSQNCVVYTGTHDNDTTLGWLNSIRGREKKNVERYIGKIDDGAISRIMEMAFASVARVAIIPMQDVLELDEKSRMNIPGTPNGNWEWRFHWNQLKKRQKIFLSELTEKYNRLH